MQGLERVWQAYGQIQGLGEVRSLGAVLLWLALAAYMLRELYRLVTDGRADFLTPILKISLAIVLVNSIDSIQAYGCGLIDAAASKLFDHNVKLLALKSILCVYKGIENASFFDFSERMFSPAGILYAGSAIILFLVMGIKFIVIDVVWPVMFTLVLFSGSIAVPIGVFPGVSTFKGWILNLVEIGLWPIVFTLVTTLLFTAYAGQLDDIERTGNLWESQTKVQQAVSDGEQLTEQDRQGAAVGFFTLLRYLAINATYGIMCLFVPMMSRKIVRSESAGFLGGIMTAMGARMAVGLVTSIGSRVFGSVRATTRFAYNSPILAWARKESAPNREKLKETLDAR